MRNGLRNEDVKANVSPIIVCKLFKQFFQVLLCNKITNIQYWNFNLISMRYFPKRRKNSSKELLFFFSI